jgi:hypothetical protein
VAKVAGPSARLPKGAQIALRALREALYECGVVPPASNFCLADISKLGGGTNQNVPPVYLPQPATCSDVFLKYVKMFRMFRKMFLDVFRNKRTSPLKRAVLCSSCSPFAEGFYPAKKARQYLEFSIPSRFSNPSAT